jgi:predicted dehydrogenase
MGAGMIGREHARLVSQHAKTELVGIADPAPGGATLAKELGVAHFADYRAMLDTVKPDGAIVAVPNKLHVDAGLACVERGIVSLVEKPLADTLEGAKRLAAASETAGIAMLTGHHRRHSPDIREARRVVRSGAIGALTVVNGMWLADKPGAYFDATWRRESGGGPILINLIHDIDCLRFICGEIESVRAVVSNAARGFAIEDTAAVVLTFENGAIGTFVLSDSVVSPYNWERTSGQGAYFPHQPGDCYFFGGREGALAVPSMTLWRHQKKDEHWQHPLVSVHQSLDGSRTYANQMDHFVAVVRGEAKPVIDAREGMLTLAATLAVARSAREDRAVIIKHMIA